jgi:DNA-binding GntR family transcriptional regulator
MGKKNIAYDYLKNGIINNLFKPGEPLSENSITNDINISTTPIREAIQKLEEEGFVEIIPRRGAFVSRISPNDIKDIFVVREIIEIGSIGIAIKKMDKNKLKRLRKRLESGSKKIKQKNENYKYADDIHLYILECTGNQRLFQLYTKLLDHILRIRISFSDHNPSLQSFNEHIEILDALLAEDQLKAENALRFHLKNSYDRFSQGL